MQFAVTFRHMDATEALKNYARERLERVERYFADPIAIHVVFSTERHHHRVDVNLLLRNGFKIAGRETTENMYSSIDLVAAKIERQVRRYKDKLHEHKTREVEPLAVMHSVLAEPGQGATGPTENPVPASTEPLILQRERIEAAPMAVSEAIMQMNLLDVPFYVFLNDKSRQVSVIYRRGEGYGLIETTSPG